MIHLWPYEKEPILFRKLIPEEDNRETFKYIFKVAKFSYHVIDCKVENIVGYMKEVVQIENSTQYSVRTYFFNFVYSVPTLQIYITYICCATDFQYLLSGFAIL